MILSIINRMNVCTQPMLCLYAQRLTFKDIMHDIRCYTIYDMEIAGLVEDGISDNPIRSGIVISKRPLQIFTVCSVQITTPQLEIFLSELRS